MFLRAPAEYVRMAKPGPEPEVTEEDVLGVFETRRDASEPLTASDVADALGCSRRTALTRLNDLAERGALEKKQVGARAGVYWVAEREADHAPAEPLRALTNMMDGDEAARVRERSKTWREDFDEDIGVGEV